MTTNQLEYFIAVAENLNFTKAAEHFYISQTAITQQMKVLEESLGAKLFNRTKRKVELTPAGKVFLTEAKAIVERTRVAADKVRVASTGLLGSLRIGYVKGFEFGNLPDVISHFHAAYPNVELYLRRANADSLMKQLNDGILDLIITVDFDAFHHYGHLSSLKLTDYPLMAVLSATHPYASRNSIKRSELAGETLFIMHAESLEPSKSNDQILEHNYIRGLNPKAIRYSGDIETILILVAAQVGICILPAYALENVSFVKNVIAIPLEGEDEFIDIQAYYDPANTNEGITRFLAYLKS